MDKTEFLDFCEREFLKRGFIKVKKSYYLDGPRDITCGIFLQKSNFGSCYYINIGFFIKEQESPAKYPSYYEMDIDGRMQIHSRHGITSQIDYEDYCEEDLSADFEKAFNTRILPPITEGKSFILKNIGKLYTLTTNPEQVMKKLKA